MAGALDVVGELMVEVDEVSARVEARGDTIVLALPGLRAGAAILRRAAAGRGRGRLIRRAHEGLVAAGLRLEVVVGSRVVGLLGVGARPAPLSRLLGIWPLELRVGGLLASRRRSRG